MLKIISVIISLCRRQFCTREKKKLCNKKLFTEKKTFFGGQPVLHASQHYHAIATTQQIAMEKM